MELDMKRCTRCDIEKVLTAFGRMSKHPDGLRYACRSCYSEIERERRLNDPTIRERERERYRSNPAQKLSSPSARRWSKSERVKLSKIASQRVMRAVKKGILTRPNRCQRCGKEGYVEGAHTDYSAPLDVLWLCRPCHRRWDAAAPKTKAG